MVLLWYRTHFLLGLYLTVVCLQTGHAAEFCPQWGPVLLQKEMRPATGAIALHESELNDSEAAAARKSTHKTKTWQASVGLSSTGQEDILLDKIQLEALSKILPETPSITDYILRHDGMLPNIFNEEDSKSCVLEAISTQVLAFWAVIVALVVNSGFLMWQSLRSVEKRSAIALAVIGAVYFGIDNFLIAYSSRYLCDPSQHMPILFLMIGCLALLVHVALQIFSMSYRQEWMMLWAFSWTEPVLSAAAGFSVGMAQVFANKSFTADQLNAGANQALVCANIVFVSTFFWFSRGEAMNFVQGIGCVVMMVGVVLMAGADDMDAASTSGRASGFGWMVLSTMMYASSIVLLRYAGLRGLSSERARLVLVIISMGAAGLGLHTFGHSSTSLSKVVAEPYRLLWPTANALAGAMGMGAVLMAYEVPSANTGLVTGVVDSNSVVMTALNFLLLSYFPEWDKVMGMGFILVAVAGLAGLEALKEMPVADKDGEEGAIDWDEMSVHA